MSNALPDTADEGLQLPALRDDLQLVRGPQGIDGAPTWRIFDPIQNRFFQIGWGIFQLLSRWHCGTSMRLEHEVNEGTTYSTDQAEIREVVRFLHANSLTRDPPSGSFRDDVERAAAQRTAWIKRILFHYLFFRIPLVKPQRFLERTLPAVEFLFRGSTRNMLLALGVCGVYLVAREWDQFTTTLLDFLNLEGFVLYVLCLTGAKVLHELGHAYTAVRYGSKVSTMGIAFLVMFPVLYTDTTDAWRLRSRRERVLIGAGGMITELYIAMVATFLWTVLPPGLPKSLAFVLATVTWVTTLLVNLNPLMRFDGYYILSDLLGIQNLQDRSFALARWHLRSMLFGVRPNPPERLPAKLTVSLIAYAYFVWIYRFLLFVAIAVLIYQFVFKALGVLLFTTEILWFIILPISREVGEWWRMRNAVASSKRAYLTLTILGLGVISLVVPWSGHLSVPAILQSKVHFRIFTPTEGRIAELNMDNGRWVTAGEELVRLENAALTLDAEQVGRRIGVIELRLKRRSASVAERADTHVLLQQLETERSTLTALQDELDGLSLRSPVDGLVTDLSRGLAPARWINQSLALARVVKPDLPEVIALVPEVSISRVAVGQHGEFIPDDLQAPIVRVRVVEVAAANAETLELPYLASQFGGDVSVRSNSDGQLVPEASVYQVKLEPLGGAPSVNQVTRGIVNLEASPRSYAARLYESVLSVLIRETGF